MEHRARILTFGTMYYIIGKQIKEAMKNWCLGGDIKEESARYDAERTRLKCND